MDATTRIRFKIIPLIFLISFGGVGAVLYTPALPQIGEELGINARLAQLTMTFFLFGYAVGQLPYGPLANALGRRKSIWVGSAIGVIGSAICALAPGIWVLNVGRVVQAFGMAVGLSLTFTLVGDLYEGITARRVVAYVTLAVAFFPAIGVAIGGFLTHYLGWRSCFWFTAGYAIAVAALTTCLPQTGPETGLHHLHLKQVARGYWNQFRNPLVILGSVIFGLASMLTYLFSVEAPFIGIDRLGLSADAFGLYNLIIYIGSIAGALMVARLAHRLSGFQLMGTGLTSIGIFSIAMLLFFWFGKITIWTLFVPAAFIFFGNPLQKGVVTSAITSRAEDKSNASSVMSFLNMALATLAVLLIGAFDSANVLIMPIMFVMVWALLVVLCLILYRLKKRGII